MPNGHDEPLEQYAPQGYVEDGYFANGHEYPNSQPDYIQGQPEMYYEPQLENQAGMCRRQPSKRGAIWL